MLKDLQKPKVIIFDWDNTLALNRDVVVAAMNKVLAKYGKDDWEKTKKEKRDNNKSLKENFANFFGDDEKQAYDDYLKFYNEFNHLLSAPEHALEMLELLSKKDLKIIIVSNKERSLLLDEINVLYPNIKFFKIMANGDSEKNKPDASPVFTSLVDTNIEINPQNVWIIGDSKQDIDCAYNANIQPILYGKGKLAEANYFEEKRKAIPKMESIDSFSEIIEIF